MITTILAIIYISFICHAYGEMLFRLFCKLSKSDMPFVQSYPLTCFSGMAFVGFIATLLSLFFPLDNIIVHLVFLLPVTYVMTKGYSPLKAASEEIRSVLAKPVLLLLFVVSVILVLVMHAWTINHPDTLIYHAQSVKWIQEYRVVPGLANLQVHYGFQSAWFVICALFSFSFTGTDAITFINAAVLIWFFLFILQKINAYLVIKGTTLNITPGFLWLSLFILSFVIYTQVRLTATSASPDFIVAIYLWLIIYLFFQSWYKNHPVHILQLLFLGFFAITLKLSALPAILFPLFVYFRKKEQQVHGWITPVIMGLFVLSPILARYIVTTGYLLYPLSFPDIIVADWKVPHELTTITRQYITAYARTHIEYDHDEIRQVINMSLSEWVPVWWKTLALTDKIILVSNLAGLLLLLPYWKSLSNNQNKLLLPGFIFLCLSIVSWFFSAPDPRFGYGFLIPASGLVLFLMVENVKKVKRSYATGLKFCLYIFSLVLAIYTVHRFKNYFEIRQIVTPIGIKKTSYQSIECNGIILNVPPANFKCGDLPLPCAQDGCTNFTPRGKTISAGFKAAKK